MSAGLRETGNRAHLFRKHSAKRLGCTCFSAAKYLLKSSRTGRSLGKTGLSDFWRDIRRGSPPPLHEPHLKMCPHGHRDLFRVGTRQCRTDRQPDRASPRTQAPVQRCRYRRAKRRQLVRSPYLRRETIRPAFQHFGQFLTRKFSERQAYFALRDSALAERHAASLIFSMSLR